MIVGNFAFDFGEMDTPPEATIFHDELVKSCIQSRAERLLSSRLLKIPANREIGCTSTAESARWYRGNKLHARVRDLFWWHSNIHNQEIAHAHRVHTNLSWRNVLQNKMTASDYDGCRQCTIHPTQTHMYNVSIVTSN